MQYIHFIKFEDVQRQGLPIETFLEWYITAKRLCYEESLFVTLDNGRPCGNNIIAYVSSLNFMPGRNTLVIKINTFDKKDDDDIYRREEALRILERRQYCQIGEKGKYFTLTYLPIIYKEGENK